MVTRRSSWPYRCAAVVLFVAAFGVDAIAKLGPLGDWSALFDVVVNVALILGGVAALVVGARKDREYERSVAQDDY